MAEWVNTPLGEVRRATSENWLLRLPCGHVEKLDERQLHGNLSVNHAATGCPSGYHETHDYYAAWLSSPSNPQGSLPGGGEG